MGQQTTAQARVIDPILTAVARAAAMQQAMVANVLFPTVPVGQRAGKIISFSNEGFKLYNTVRAPGANTKRVQFGFDVEQAFAHAVSSSQEVEKLHIQKQTFFNDMCNFEWIRGGLHHDSYEQVPGGTDQSGQTPTFQLSGAFHEQTTPHHHRFGLCICRCHLDARTRCWQPLCRQDPGRWLPSGPCRHQGQIRPNAQHIQRSIGGLAVDHNI